MLSTSILRTISFGFLRSQKPLPEVKKSYRLYRDLKHLPLDRFIECSCNNDLRQLIIEGEPPEHELQQTWEALYLRYIEIVGGADVMERLEMIKEVNLISLRVNRIEALFEVLDVAPSEALFGQLYNLGYEIPELPYNDANMQTLCKRITALMKREVVRLQELQQRLDSEGGDGKQMTEQDYYNLLVEIADVFKVVLKESETSVFVFATYLCKYKQKAEAARAQQVKNSIV